MEKQWSEILSQLKVTTGLSSAEYRVWLLPLKGEVDYTGSQPRLLLKAKSQYAAKWIRNNHFALIQKVSNSTLGLEVEVEIKVEEEEKNYTAKEVVTNIPTAPTVLATQGQDILPLNMPVARMNPSQSCINKMKHSFDTFVVGGCNLLAHAAAKSIVKSDPLTEMLFLSSAPGLGKTHLTQALGKAMYQESKQNKLNMAYLTAQEFTSQFSISSICNTLPQFKERFNSLDLLLLEDVHFFNIGKKNKSQEELIRIINEMQTRGGRVVFTSSFAPKEMLNIDSFLSSRFNSGFVVSLEYPDFDTKKEMLLKKASLRNFVLPEKVADLFAQQIEGDIRLLESSLNNLLLKSQTLNLPITEDLAYSIIANVAPQNSELSLNELLKLVCSCYGISNEQMYSRSRKNEYVMARNTAYYLIRKHFTLTLQDIGDKFNKKHSTISKAITHVEEEIAKKTKLGSQFMHTINAIEERSHFLKV